MAQTDKKPVLLLAEMCNPAWASVPLVGWQHVAHLAQVTSVHLVTHVVNQEDIEARKPSFPVTYITYDWADRLFTSISRRLFGSDYSKASLTLLKIPFYIWFEWRVWWRLRGEFKRNQFSLIHRLTPVSPAVPSMIAWLTRNRNLPFVLGPINGGLPWPKGYESAARDREWISRFRHYYHVLPFISSMRKRAELILVGSHFTKDEIPRKFHAKCRYFPENAVDENLLLNAERKDVTSTLKVVFVGRLVALKGPDIVLRASLPYLRQKSMHLEFVGDGPLMSELRDIVAKENLQDQVRFHGWIAQQSQVQKMMQDFHVLAFPSVREFGGGVVVEAMAKGVVPIVLDYGGPGEIVTAESGIKLALLDQEQTIQSLNRAIGEVLNDRERLKTMSAQAIERVRKFYTWQSKAQMILQFYQELEFRG
ncbi:MAG: glycosyltransferase family 4 protein [Oligoflexus sp.]